jgi:hypothetical protein
MAKRTESQRQQRQASAHNGSLHGIGRDLSKLVTRTDVDEARVEHLLEVAADLGATDPATITPFLLKHLLPRCVHAPSDDAVSRARSGRMRRLLVNWLDSLPEGTLWDVRDAAIRFVVNALREAPTFEGLYCLAAIGYRSSDTVAAFRELGQREDRLGHEALRMLLGLAPDAQVLNWVSRRIHSTPYPERTDELLNAAAQMHDIKFLEFLVEDAIRRGPSLFALPRLMWVGKEAPGDRAVQEGVWRAVSAVANSWPEGNRHLILTGGLVRGCHTPSALGAFVALIPQFAESGGPLIECLRQVVEAASPTQLEGWGAALTSGIGAALRRLIETDTGQKSVGQTAESLQKEIAIDALLCSGDPDTVPILGAAINEESNAYVCAEIMRSLAMLPLQDLPTKVDDLLSTEKGFASRTDENERIVVYLASARVAASARSIAALSRLMHSNGLIDGHPLTVPVAGAIRQAVWLAGQHRSQVTEMLIASTSDPSPMAQIVSAKSLGLLMEASPLNTATGPLNRLVQDVRAMPYVRRAALAARATLNDRERDSELRRLLVQCSGDNDESVRLAAVSTLVAIGAVEDERQTIEEYVLGEKAASDRRHRALVLGQLAAAEPSRYSGHAATLIAGGDGDTAHAVLDGYQELEDGDAPLPQSIADAIVARIRRDESEVSANPPMLDALAVLAPGRLLTERWEDVWQRWMPQSRSVFAELVPSAVARAGGQDDRAEELLLLLIGDPAFGVRRSASRSLGRLRPAALEAWCADAYQSGSIHLRCLAMEAASWLQIDSEQTLDNAMIRVGLADAERSVRDTAERCQGEMRRRAWARSLLHEVKTGARNIEEHVNTHYRFGHALARIGDDEDLRELESMSRDTTYPPNVSYWFERTAEQLAKQWKRTTEAWPQPWLQWEGAIERVRGTVSAKGTDHTLDLHLWRRRARGAEGFSGWGGAAPILSGADMWRFAQAHEEVVVQVENRRPARALIVGVNNNGIVLTGTGPYPSESAGE